MVQQLRHMPHKSAAADPAMAHFQGGGFKGLEFWPGASESAQDLGPHEAGAE
jgi:hypothetical protein